MGADDGPTLMPTNLLMPDLVLLQKATAKCDVCGRNCGNTHIDIDCERSTEKDTLVSPTELEIPT